jgi:hypothetical protein
MKALAFGILYIIVVGSIFNAMGVFAEQNNLITSSVGRLMIRLYVFNDKTQTWDRAREETVKNISCDKLRGFGLPTNAEYLIEAEK